MVNYEIFNYEERSIINNNAKGTPIELFTRERCLEALRDARDISTEGYITELYDGLIKKVEGVSDDDWEQLRERIPFFVPVDDDIFEGQ